MKELSNVASISSSDGWNFVEFTFSEKLTVDKQILFLTLLKSKGKFWDRKKSLISVLDAQLIDDYFVHIPQIVITEAGIDSLIVNLETWLESFSEFKCDLSLNTNQQISVSVGQREGYIYKPERPVFRFEYISQRMKVEWAFIIDQSCVNLFLQELKEALSNM